jgi:hypothetical protein
MKILKILMFFERCIKNILEIFFRKKMKKQWSEGACVAPYSVNGPLLLF